MRKRLKRSNRILLAMLGVAILCVHSAAHWQSVGLMYVATILFVVAFIWNKRLSVARSIYWHEQVRELAREDVRNHKARLWI